MSGFVEALRAELGSIFEDGRVLLPRNAREVGHAVRIAHARGGRLTPPGGEPRKGAIVVDLRHMSAVIAVDDTSHLAHVEAGMDVAVLEAELGRRGLTLGIEGRPPETSVGAWIAYGAPGARDHQNDPVDQLIAGLEAVLPDGRTLAIRPAPRRAVGPDLLSTFVGARARLGVAVGVHLVAKRREPSVVVAYRFDDRQSADHARAWIRGRGVRPAAADVVASAVSTVLRVRLTGEGPLLAARRAVVDDVAVARGGTALATDTIREAPAPGTPLLSPIVRSVAAVLDENAVLGG